MSLSGKTTLTTARTIVNDGHWPNLTVGELTENYRIPTEYADGVLFTGIVVGMMRVNERLEPVKLQMIAIGHHSLASYTGTFINALNEKPLLLTQYQHAVYCWAKGYLLQNFNSLNRKPEAENAAKESDETYTFWLNEAQTSIAQIFADVLPDQPVSTRANVFAALI